MSEYARCERKRPLIRLARRQTASLRRKIIVRTLAVVGAFATGGLLLLLMGKNPFDVYASLLRGTFGQSVSIRETVKYMVPLLVTGMAVALSFKMRFWNIGAEGHILIGGVAATAVVVYLPMLSAPLKLVLMALSAMVVAGLFAAIPAGFKARFGTNETLFTLMLNYIALQLVMFLMYQPGWQQTGTTYPKIRAFPATARLPKVLGIHIGWIVALIVVVLYWLYVRKTKHGFEVSVVGESVSTARYAGMNVSRIFIRTMFISGALAGLVGFMQTAGADGTLTESTAGGVGYTAITIAWLSRMNSFAMVFVSLLIAVLERGARSIQTSHGIPDSAAKLLTGLILFFMLGAEFFIDYRVIVRGRACR